MSLGDLFKTTAAGDVPFNANVTPQGRVERRQPAGPGAEKSTPQASTTTAKSVATAAAGTAAPATAKSGTTTAPATAKSGTTATPATIRPAQGTRGTGGAAAPQGDDKAAESNTIVIEDDAVTRMEEDAATEAAAASAPEEEHAEAASMISGFVTVQSFANFSAMAGGITMAWSVLMGVNPVFRGIWVPLLAAMIWALVSLSISWRGLKTNSFRAQAAFIGVFNALVLASAVMGVHYAAMR